MKATNTTMPSAVVNPGCARGCAKYNAVRPATRMIIRTRSKFHDDDKFVGMGAAPQ